MKKTIFFCIIAFTILACNNKTKFGIDKIFKDQGNWFTVASKTNIRIISDTISKVAILNFQDTSDLKTYINAIDNSTVLYFDSLKSQFTIVSELTSPVIRGVIDMNCPPLQNLVKYGKKVLQPDTDVKSIILITTEVSQSNYFIQKDINGNFKFFFMPSKNSSNEIKSITENDFFYMLKKGI